jgi:phage shock protein PspC (stress-responsive transcriptional regulator)
MVEGRAGRHSDAMNTDTSPKKLFRSTTDRKISGVSGGLASYFNVDPTVVRVGWIGATLFTGGAAIVAYLAMMIVVPSEDELHSLPV